MVSYCMFYFNISSPLGKDFFYLWILIVLKIYTPAKLIYTTAQALWADNLVPKPGSTTY